VEKKEISREIQTKNEFLNGLEPQLNTILKVLQNEFKDYIFILSYFYLQTKVLRFLSGHNTNTRILGSAVGE
jgi:hypothetical protein